MSEKNEGKVESKPMAAPRRVPTPKEQALLQELQRTTMKLNTRSLLDQEFQESLGQFINNALKLIQELSDEIEALKKEKKPEEKKSKS